MKQYRRVKINERGQTLPLLALLIVVLILFIGLAIDFGFAYVTRANLSKAVDAAALAGIRNVSAQGETPAKAIATNSFNMNYGSPGRDTSAPTVSLSFVNDPSGAKFFNVDAVATINTFFIRILPQFTTLNVSAHAQAKRSPLVMSLVLDRSGSMNLNGGSTALPPAASDFIANFDDNIDRVSMVSFATGHNVDVQVTRPFINTIQSKVGALNSNNFSGGTFTVGGLQDAVAQNASITDPNVVKVVVLFTDGWANMVEDVLSCPASQQMIYGGCSPPEQAVGWCSGVSFFPGNITNINDRSGVGCSANQFPSAQNGGRSTSINITNASNDAIYRAEQLASTLRSQGMTVYAIGLGDKISQGFLDDLANVPGAATFNSNQTQGAVVLAPTAADLDQAFQTVAKQILFRLTQ
jgi:Mg-chelatase subunit ChlD